MPTWLVIGPALVADSWLTLYPTIWSATNPPATSDDTTLSFLFGRRLLYARDRSRVATKSAAMASLLPLLQDLLPMIMPSQVRVTRSHQLVPVPERAERPPWYQQPPHVVDEEQKSLTSDSDLGKNAEPILLFDHEPATAAAVKDGAAPGQRPIDEPAVFRKDAMVGVSDTMCATGECQSTQF